MVATGPFVPAVAALRGVPWQDVVREVLAAVALLVALGQSWDFATKGGGHVAVVLVTLLSVASLAITYGKRLGIFPATVPASTLALLRGLCAVPYLVVVVVFVVADAIASSGSVRQHFSGGVGVAVGLGLAGALLAAQPRRSELPELDPRAQLVVARTVLGVLAAVIVVRPVISLITWSFTDANSYSSSYSYYGGGFHAKLVFFLVALALLAVAVPALSLVGSLRGSRAARTVLWALAGTAIASTLLSLGSTVDSADGTSIPGLIGVSLWAAAAAAASSPALVIHDAGSEPPAASAARALLSTLVVATVGIALVDVSLLILLEGDSGGTTTSLVTSVIVAVLALVARARLQGPAAATTAARTAALVLCGIAAVVGLVEYLSAGSDLLGESTNYRYGLSGMSPLGAYLCIAIGLPLAVIMVLTAPALMTNLAASRSTRAQGYPGLAPEPTVAVPHPTTRSQPVVAPQPVRGPEWVAAADPATPLAELADLAHRHPHVRAVVAANPSTYPDLLAWLGELGDPQVEAALRVRARA